MKDRSREAEKRVEKRYVLPNPVYYHAERPVFESGFADEFHTQLSSLISARPDAKVLVIDLEGVGYLAKENIAVIHGMHKRLNQNGGQGVVLLDVSEKVKQKLDRLGFGLIFRQFESGM